MSPYPQHDIENTRRRLSVDVVNACIRTDQRVEDYDSRSFHIAGLCSLIKLARSCVVNSCSCEICLRDGALMFYRGRFVISRDLWTSRGSPSRLSP